MDRNLLCDSLINWLKSLNVCPQDATIDFCDGLYISKCLNHIDPQYFDENWLSKLKPDVNGNWRLKLLNLKKIVDTLTDYYSEVLNHPLSDFDMPMLNNMFDDTMELSKLLQLVLGVAVNCESKSEFIKNIMEMNMNEQHMIMTAIQDLQMSKETHDESTNQLKRLQVELNRVNEQKEEITQKCHDLDSQLAILHEEKQAFIKENELLKQKLQFEDTKRDEHDRLEKLQHKIDNMQDELHKLDTIREEYRIKYQAAKMENETLIEKNAELKKVARDTQLLNDELDVLRHTADKANKLEATIEAYKIKLEEMSDLRSQIKLLEGSNTKYMETIIQMEEEAKRITLMKTQIDAYKKQIQELHENTLTQEMKIKKYDYENKRYEEKLNLLQQEKEGLLNEIESLKQNRHDHGEYVDDDDRLLINNSLNQSKPLDDAFDQISDMEMLNLPLDIKEKFIRLYHENRNLKSKQSEINEDNFILLQSQYDDEKQRNADLQVKLSTMQAKQIEFESRIAELQQESTKDQNKDQINTVKLTEIYELKNKLAGKNMQLSDECKRLTVTIRDLEADIEILQKEKAELKQTVTAKEKEAVDLKEKYEIYLEKAKFIIKMLDPNNSQLLNAEISSLKSQLNEKEKKVIELVNENERLKTSLEKEEQYLASALSKLANFNAMDDRLEHCLNGNSFLSQQRNIFLQRQQAPKTNQTNGNP